MVLFDAINPSNNIQWEFVCLFSEDLEVEGEDGADHESSKLGEPI